MIVLDASAAIEFLLATATGEGIRERMGAAGWSVHAPHLIDPEVLQVLRRKCASGEVEPERAEGAVVDLGDLRLRRYPHGPLTAAAWALRENVTAYDGMYVALASLLDAPLVTTDERLSRTPGGPAVEVIASPS